MSLIRESEFLGLPRTFLNHFFHTYAVPPVLTVRLRQAASLILSNT
jgi:hypothetical protein